MANKMDQAKLLMRARKLQKELANEIITVEAGEGAVRIDISGEQKIKKIHIDPDYIDKDDIGQLELWLEQAVREAINQSQKLAAEKMQPMMGMLGGLGL
ncbi:MAG TPA: YbaB/EbfC family nucleoid-associated protein [Candidatus Saccharimonadales bacterium]|nr:YbaB/EbfC family nucleoid-associated protein [Candidatus Saccharimonadales bacterium]